MFGIFGKKPDVRRMFDDGKWQVAQGEYDGNPIIVRYNGALRPFVGKSDHTLKIAFAIPLNTPSENGLPSAVENQELQLVEDKILDAVRSRTSVVQALAITTGTLKEYVFYTRRDINVQDMHEQLMASITSHEVQCMASVEESWETYVAWAKG